MGFIQIIELKTHDIEAVRELQDHYRRATAGKNTIRGEILAQDREDRRRYFNIVFFDSYESAFGTCRRIRRRVDAHVRASACDAARYHWNG